MLPLFYSASFLPSLSTNNHFSLKANRINRKAQSTAFSNSLTRLLSISNISLIMALTFSNALASLGPFDSRWLIPRQNNSFPCSHRNVAVDGLLGAIWRDFRLASSSSRRTAEDALSKPAEKQPKMHEADTSSSPPVAPVRKRKAEDEPSVPSEKPVKMRKESRPRASLDSEEFKIAESLKPSKSPSTMSFRHQNDAAPSTTSLAHKNIAKPGSASKGSFMNPKHEKPTPVPSTSITPKTILKAASTPKHAQLGSRTDKPALNLTASSRPEQRAISPTEPTRALQDPDSAPPKKGSYLELMSRKASDMIKLPKVPEPTGKQIKEAAKAAKKALGARREKPYSVHTDPHLRHWSAKQKNAVIAKHRQIAHERVSKKIPRRAYNGTGAISQASSEGTTGVLKTTAPLVRSRSSESATPSGNSSSDMEAGYMAVEDEESRAARTAKQEDEEEARLEAELKKAKERRRMREARATPRPR